MSTQTPPRTYNTRCVILPFAFKSPRGRLRRQHCSMRPLVGDLHKWKVYMPSTQRAGYKVDSKLRQVASTGLADETENKTFLPKKSDVISNNVTCLPSVSSIALSTAAPKTAVLHHSLQCRLTGTAAPAGCSCRCSRRWVGSSNSSSNRSDNSTRCRVAIVVAAACSLLPTCLPPSGTTWGACSLPL